MDKKNIFGYLLINKPSGISSHDVINYLRKITNIKKIGHAGTLDPLAEGLLFVAINRKATKNISKFSKLDKTYIAEIKLGEATDTYDAEGKIIKKYKGKKINKKLIKKTLKKFIGEQKQIPPMYSAKKIKGKKLYDLARKNIVVDREASLINIYKIKLIKYRWPIIKIKIRCSTGTYIRSLAYDIGLDLYCGAYLKNLKRIKIGKYKLKKAKDLNLLNNNNWDKKIIKICVE